MGFYDLQPPDYRLMQSGWLSQTPTTTPAASSAPRSGNGPFGLVPGPLGDISDIAYNDLLKRLPGLADSTAQASGNVLSKLRGQLSPETQAAIQDKSAAFGLLSGMPGGQMNRFRTARDLGLATEGLQSQGLQELGGLVGIGRGMNVSPETQIGARERDLNLAAAPDPAAQASYAKSLFDQYLNSLSRGGRSPAGGGGGNDFGNILKSLTPNPAGGTGAGRSNVPSNNGNSFDSMFGSDDWLFGMDGWEQNGGWGETSNSNGGFASIGNVPVGESFNGTPWDDLTFADDFYGFDWEGLG
jgi:hypothetical protein